MPKILILTGPGGSGKTTLAKMLESEYGYAYVDGDQEDTEFFSDGGQWLPENLMLLRQAHDKILKKTMDLHEQGQDVVIDYIIFDQYLEFLEMFRQKFGDDLYIKVLMPSVDELIERDKQRKCWTTGEDRITEVSKQFKDIRTAIGSNNFIDSSGQNPEKTLHIILLELNLTIRGYKESDFEEVWHLHELALKAAGAFVAGHGEWDEDLKNISEVYENAGGSFMIAELEGKIIGMGALKRVNAETAEIKRMRVLPEYQGKGLGTKLLKLLEGRAKELGYERLILDTSLQQQAALHVYTKHGYKEYKRGKLGGLDTVWLEKSI